MDVFSQLSAFLNSIGLGRLFTLASDGTPSGWLWEQVQNGVSSQEELLLNLESTPEFRERFKVIFDMRDRASKGENVAVPTVTEVLTYENSYRQLMAQANVPPSFYDSYDDAQNAIRNNLTVEQIADRIDSSYAIVKNMPTEVRDAFTEFYGDASEGALVAAVLDPQKALSTLDRQTRAAQLAGFARQQRVSISRQQAEQFAGLGSTAQGAAGTEQVREVAGRVAELAPLGEAQMGESALTAGADAAFRAGALGDVEATRQLGRRLATRQQGQQTSAGGAMVSQSGVTGV